MLYWFIVRGSMIDTWGHVGWSTRRCGLLYGHRHPQRAGRGQQHVCVPRCYRCYLLVVLTVCYGKQHIFIDRWIMIIIEHFLKWKLWPWLINICYTWWWWWFCVSENGDCPVRCVTLPEGKQCVLRAGCSVFRASANRILNDFNFNCNWMMLDSNLTGITINRVVSCTESTKFCACDGTHFRACHIACSKFETHPQESPTKKHQWGCLLLGVRIGSL